jgi:sulfur carrier protein
MTTVTVNGERCEVPDGLTVTALIEHLGIKGDRVAIERNLNILPRAQWSDTKVQPNDTFEIVHLVGGGCSVTGEADGQP